MVSKVAVVFRKAGLPVGLGRLLNARAIPLTRVADSEDDTRSR
jgi:hypothetical protein